MEIIEIANTTEISKEDGNWVCVMPEVDNPMAAINDFRQISGKDPQKIYVRHMTNGVYKGRSAYYCIL